jgi:hypothetical protein
MGAEAQTLTSSRRSRPLVHKCVPDPVLVLEPLGTWREERRDRGAARTSLPDPVPRGAVVALAPDHYARLAAGARLMRLLTVASCLSARQRLSRPSPCPSRPLARFEPFVRRWGRRGARAVGVETAARGTRPRSRSALQRGNHATAAEARRHAELASACSRREL